MSLGCHLWQQTRCVKQFLKKWTQVVIYIPFSTCMYVSAHICTYDFMYSFIYLKEVGRNKQTCNIVLKGQNIATLPEKTKKQNGTLGWLERYMVCSIAMTHRLTYMCCFKSLFEMLTKVIDLKCQYVSEAVLTLVILSSARPHVWVKCLQLLRHILRAWRMKTIL